jgi:two-component system nitrate/nitrite response regulator NarL
LSSREAEILHCLMQGAPNKIIARKLEVAEATVKVHIKAILRKIRVTNRTQAAMWAVAHFPPSNGDEARPGAR